MQALSFSACSDVVSINIALVRAALLTTESEISVYQFVSTHIFSFVPQSEDQNTVIELCVYIAPSVCVCTRATAGYSTSQTISILSSPARRRAFLLLLCPRTRASRLPSSSLSTRALIASRKNSATSKVRTRRECFATCLFGTVLEVDRHHFLLCLFPLANSQLGVVTPCESTHGCNFRIWPYSVVSS